MPLKVLAMRTPFKVSLVAACAVCLAAMLAVMLNHDTIDGHALTPSEHLPVALISGAFFAPLALLGTWLGLRGAKIQRLTYRTGLVVALLYVGATFVADALLALTGPITETFPSQEADIDLLRVLLIGALWGTGAPYLIALLVRRSTFF
jgi:hypothetical protein